jgi:hypothetical protein
LTNEIDGEAIGTVVDVVEVVEVVDVVELVVEEVVDVVGAAVVVVVVVVVVVGLVGSGAILTCLPCLMATNSATVMTGIHSPFWQASTYRPSVPHGSLPAVHAPHITCSV